MVLSVTNSNRTLIQLLKLKKDQEEEEKLWISKNLFDEETLYFSDHQFFKVEHNQSEALLLIVFDENNNSFSSLLIDLDTLSTKVLMKGISLNKFDYLHRKMNCMQKKNEFDCIFLGVYMITQIRLSFDKSQNTMAIREIQQKYSSLTIHNLRDDFQPVIVQNENVIIFYNKSQSPQYLHVYSKKYLYQILLIELDPQFTIYQTKITDKWLYLLLHK